MTDAPHAAGRVLVIKHGALGDFVLALGPARAIRDHHPAARITLLTTPPFAALARLCPWFDEVWTDDRPRWSRPGAWLALRRRLRAAAFDRVYDLQTSYRSNAYFYLLGPGRRPAWCGIALGAAHRHTDPRRRRLHTIERQAGQLAAAGIRGVPLPDVGWLGGAASALAPDRPYALVVPGGSAHRPEKRWPAERFAALAKWLAERGLTPVLVGGAGERRLTEAIAAACPGAVDLAGATDLAEIIALARGARLAVGNDTGPMHLVAVAGCPTVTLFSSHSDPARCAPRGPEATWLRRADLSALPLASVTAALAGALADARGPAPRPA